MNIRKVLKWSLVLMAFLAYKQLDSGGDAAGGKPELVYMAYEAET